jgi:phage-related protein
MAEFTWTPDFNATKTPRSNVVESKFGDGYSQRIQVGMNANAQDWSLAFTNRSAEEATEIDEFLTERGGVESFDFTPPGEEDSIKVVCRTGQWSKVTVKHNLFTINAKFEQVFEP